MDFILKNNKSMLLKCFLLTFTFLILTSICQVGGRKKHYLISVKDNKEKAKDYMNDEKLRESESEDIRKVVEFAFFRGHPSDPHSCFIHKNEEIRKRVDGSNKTVRVYCKDGCLEFKQVLIDYFKADI